MCVRNLVFICPTAKKRCGPEGPQLCVTGAEGNCCSEAGRKGRSLLGKDLLRPLAVLRSGVEPLREPSPAVAEQCPRPACARSQRRRSPGKWTGGVNGSDEKAV